MLLLTTNRKPYVVSPMTSSLLTLSDLERSKSRSLEFWVEGDLHGIDILASCYITTLIWMSQKVVCWRAGFPLSCLNKDVFFSISFCFFLFFFLFSFLYFFLLFTFFLLEPPSSSSLSSSFFLLPLLFIFFLPSIPWVSTSPVSIYHPVAMHHPCPFPPICYILSFSWYLCSSCLHNETCLLFNSYFFVSHAPCVFLRVSLLIFTTLLPCAIRVPFLPSLHTLPLSVPTVYNIYLFFNSSHFLPPSPMFGTMYHVV